MRSAFLRMSPVAWLLFGFFGFPTLCLISEIMGWLVIIRSGLAPKSTPEFGWGGAPGMFLGVPLGIVSALCAHFWRNKLWNVARGFGAMGGATIGVIWGSWMSQLSPIAWLGDFGFSVTPFIWAGALLLFGVLARVPRSESR